MIVRGRFEINDDGRRYIAQELGKSGLATRKDVIAFLEGCLACIADEAYLPPQPHSNIDVKLDITPHERKLISELQAEGRSEGYIRGYVFRFREGMRRDQT